MATQVSPKDKGRVLKALENPNYKWRTINGVAKETGLNPELVQNVINSNSDMIVRSSVQSTEGEDLYTTRKHFQQEIPVIDRLLGAIKNRAD